MTYATGSGTLQQMLNNMATFLLADGWLPRVPGAHRYWSVLGYTRSGSITDIEGLKVYTGVPGSRVDVTSSIAALTATGGSPVITGAGIDWYYNGNRETRIVMDFGVGNTVSLTQLVLEAATGSTSYRQLALEYSEDGIVWKTACAWFPSSLGTVGTAFTGELQATYFPLSPNGGDQVVMPLIDDTYSVTTYDEVTAGSSVSHGSILTVHLGDSSVLPLGGTSGAGSKSYCMTTNVEEWHFFSDPSLCLYLHCAFRVVYGGRSYWFHLSTGELNQLGMSHHGVTYLTTSEMTPFAATSESSTSSGAQTHNSIARSGYMMGGWEASSSSSVLTTASSVQYAFTQSGGAGFPIPVGTEWPDLGVTHANGKALLPTAVPQLGGRANIDQWSYSTASSAAVGSVGWATIQHPTTGYTSLGTLPLIVVSGTFTAVSPTLVMMGEYPNVKTTRIDLLGEGSEITVGADTWMCFPLLRKTAVSNSLSKPRIPLSGPAGIAYKKVI